MPNPEDRLQELHRQRGLVQEHLAWIDREIAALSGETVRPGVAPAPLPAASPVSPPDGDPETEALLETYRTESRSSLASARRGCFILFFVALALFGLAVAGLYFYTRSLHPPGH